MVRCCLIVRIDSEHNEPFVCRSSFRFSACSYALLGIGTYQFSSFAIRWMFNNELHVQTRATSIQRSMQSRAIESATADLIEDLVFRSFQRYIRM
jgi:hypothetical protein